MLKDVVALVVQSVGGAAASTANTAVDAAKGGHIALGGYNFYLSPCRPFLTYSTGGIVFQFAAVVVYMLLSTEFFIRFLLKKPFPGREDTLNSSGQPVLDSRTKQMVIGVGLSTLAMFIR